RGRPGRGGGLSRIAAPAAPGPAERGADPARAGPAPAGTRGDPGVVAPRVRPGLAARAECPRRFRAVGDDAGRRHPALDSLAAVASRLRLLRSAARVFEGPRLTLT